MTSFGDTLPIQARWMQLLEMQENQLPNSEGEDLVALDPLRLSLSKDTSFRDLFVRNTLKIDCETELTLKCRDIYVIGGRVRFRKVKLTLISRHLFQMSLEAFSQAVRQNFEGEPVQNSLRFRSHPYDLTPDIDAKSLNGHTGLMTAAYCRDAHLVQFFIAAKADIHARAPGNWTALKLAMFRENKSVVKLLLEAKADPDEHLSIQLTLAARKGNALRVAFLLDHQVKVERGLDGALMNAVEKNQTQVIAQLIAADPEGATEFLVEAIRGGLEETVKTLLTGRIDFRRKDPRGLTPLEYAQTHGQIHIARVLAASAAVFYDQ